MTGHYPARMPNNPAHSTRGCLNSRAKLSMDIQSLGRGGASVPMRVGAPRSDMGGLISGGVADHDVRADNRRLHHDLHRALDAAADVAGEVVLVLALELPDLAGELGRVEVDVERAEDENRRRHLDEVGGEADQPAEGTEALVRVVDPLHPRSHDGVAAEGVEVEAVHARDGHGGEGVAEVPQPLRHDEPRLGLDGPVEDGEQLEAEHHNGNAAEDGNEARVAGLRSEDSGEHADDGFTHELVSS
jgi:hypothetical protein